MANTIRQHPELSVSTSDTTHDLELVLKYKRSFTAEQSNLLALMEDDFKTTGSCRFRLASNDGWLTARDSFALPKSNPVIVVFNRE